MFWADVCVNTPLGRQYRFVPEDEGTFDPIGEIFTYAVPAKLSGRLRPGHLVWVPFRSRRLQAVVLRISETPPEFETREIISLVWAQPLLGETQLELAHWISRYYLSPLIESLRLMLPAGLSKRGRTVFVRTARPRPDSLTPTQSALLARLDESEGSWEEVGHGLHGVTQRADLEPLISMGLVSREVSFPTPPPRPKTDRQVRLLADEATIRRLLPTVGRSSKQADALVWLKGRWPEGAAPRGESLKEACAAIGSTRGPFQALAACGWIEIRAADSSSPESVLLKLDRDACLDAIVELRGSRKHRAVLQALLQRGEPAWIGWVYAETGANLKVLRDLEGAGLLTIAEEMVWRDPLDGQEFTLDRPPILTADQEVVWRTLQDCLSSEVDVPDADVPDAGASSFLLFGVTGSGKTELYLRSIAEVLRRGQQAVVLVPEIALTPQTIRRFAARFPGKVTIWHSELGDGERFDVWRRVRTNHPAAQVVVGSRSALFLPYPNLGLIVIDEEHESSYKQERTPRYHARTVALALGRMSGTMVLLGSATPSLESFYAAQAGEISLLTLPRRIMGHRAEVGVLQGDLALAGAATETAMTAELPEVEIVDMRQELRVGNRSMFSRSLASEMGRVLAARQQAILYLNRRGTSTFILCRDCGHVEVCPRCAVPLTYHGAGETLLCHHCNRRYPVPTICSTCGSKRIRYFGSGTQSVEDAVHLDFPDARTLRWDRDVTGAKGSHDAILTRFIAHEADVLIGTQMIAKGLDLPLVTLVGIVAADTGLWLPDFRAGERTFQLLTQVAGRAGRSALGGRVVVQTYHPSHYAIRAAAGHDYEGFYRQEMVFRRQQGYPPVKKLARLVFYHAQRQGAEAEAKRLAAELQQVIESTGLEGVDLIGPAPCFFSLQRGMHRWNIVVRAEDPKELLHRIVLPMGWRLDIDPVDML